MSKSAQLSQSPRKTPLVLSNRALLAALLCSAAALWGAFQVDQRVLDFVNHRSGGFSRWLAHGVSLVGDWYGVAALGLLGWWQARRRNSGHWKRLLLVMAVCGTLGGLSANVIRALSGRARPHGGAPAGWYGPSEAERPVKSAYAFQSFPSAHTGVVAGFCAPMGWVALRSRRRWCLFVGVGLSLSSTLLMAWSRVWVGAHYLSDVLAAALLGWGIALAWVQCRAPGLFQYPETPHGARPS
jgi:membrane-associated phospholipid phosphatase